METSESGPHRRIHPLPLGDVQITDEFWGPRIRVNREVTLKYQLRQCEQTGRIANYEIASGEIEGEFEGIFFNDSDVYKWMEAASALLNWKDEKGKIQAVPSEVEACIIGLRGFNDPKAQDTVVKLREIMPKARNALSRYKRHVERQRKALVK